MIERRASSWQQPCLLHKDGWPQNFHLETCLKSGKPATQQTTAKTLPRLDKALGDQLLHITKSWWGHSPTVPPTGKSVRSGLGS